MSLDTRSSKEGDELGIWITGMVVGLPRQGRRTPERHGGTAVLEILDPETGQPHPKWSGWKLKGEDYIARGPWAEHGAEG
jgi:hypothetical protein